MDVCAVAERAAIVINATNVSRGRVVMSIHPRPCGPPEGARPGEGANARDVVFARGARGDKVAGCMAVPSVARFSMAASRGKR